MPELDVPHREIFLSRDVYQAEDYVRSMILVFTCGTGRTSSQAAKLAEELGFKSTTFCPLNQWTEQGYQAKPRNK